MILYASRPGSTFQGSSTEECSPVLIGRYSMCNGTKLLVIIFYVGLGLTTCTATCAGSE